LWTIVSPSGESIYIFCSQHVAKCQKHSLSGTSIAHKVRDVTR